MKSRVLTINSGSSSIKFAFYEAENLVPVLHGIMESIGSKNTSLHYTSSPGNQTNTVDVPEADHDQAVGFLIDWLVKQDSFGAVEAIGHRIVHGMNHTDPERITPALIDELRQISLFDPEHLPAAIQLIEAFVKSHPQLPQIACFDTSFHVSMPPVAKWLSIPRRFHAMGIRRYGFHGLSYTYLLEELAREAGAETTRRRLVLAHLGNGASLAAVSEGKSIDTSMGFTPTSGLMMGSRTGDLDPGVAQYLMEAEKLSPDQFSHLINHESGLLGISETSADMRELLKSQGSDYRAAQAIELFCYQAKKWIGSFAAALGGLDELVFSGGIGENAPEIRTRICFGLQFLGIELDEVKNKNNDPVISADAGRVTVRVMQTNEELMIARMVCAVLKNQIKHAL